MLYNVRMEEHVDSQDPQRSYAILAVFGDFQGGYLVYRTLGVRVRFQPGDFQLLKGKVVPHEIEPFTGQRISVPHFTHLSCWKSVGLEDLVE